VLWTVPEMSDSAIETE